MKKTGNKALVVIDVLSGIFELDRPVHGEEPFLSNIEAIIDKARGQGVRVVYIQHCGPKGSPFEEGTGGWKIHPRIAPRASDIVVRKTEPDAFQGSDLKKVLEDEGIEELYICGFATDYCVDTTVRSAYARGYAVVLVADCHTATGNEVLDAARIVDHHNVVLGRFARVQNHHEIEFKD